MATKSHRIRNISFLGRQVPILCQSENGPCPLLAICNVLLLRGSLTLSTADRVYVTEAELLQLLGNHLLAVNTGVGSDEERANMQQQIEDAVDVLPILYRGLDVNVKFCRCTDFEYTKETAVFDMFGIRLLHGWMYDSLDADLAGAIGHKSYNQLVESLASVSSPVARQLSTSPAASVDANNHFVASEEDVITTAPGAAEQTTDAAEFTNTAALASPVASPASPAPGPSQRLSPEHAATIRGWLAQSASQLTHTGLIGLYETLGENELAVFFRNNHFSVLFNRDHKLFMLVTDEGFVDQPSAVWELLDAINGDTVYASETFSLPAPSPVPASTSVVDSMPASAPASMTTQTSEDADLALAIQLQEQERLAAEQNQQTGDVPAPQPPQPMAAAPVAQPGPRAAPRVRQQQPPKFFRSGDERYKYSGDQLREANAARQARRPPTAAGVHTSAYQQEAARHRQHKNKDKSCIVQ